MTCKQAQGFLESVGGSVAAILDAKKIKLGPSDALELARRVDTLVATRGKRVVTFSLKDDCPDDETLLAHLIGPSGNLRAPSAVVGRTLVVGFNEDVYRRELDV
jgi:arsenate reductase-like glutaredoxin family protein